MGTIHLQVSHAVAPAKGAGTGVPIAVPSIHVGDTLLAVIGTTLATGAAQGFDPGAFTVAEGEIESATVSTAGLDLAVVHTTS